MQYVSKKHLIVLMVLVLILGGLLLAGERLSRTGTPALFSDRSQKQVPPSAAATATNAPLAGVSESSERFAPLPQAVTKSTASKLTYTQALELYKGSTLQFDDQCELATKSTSFHLGTEVLVDNRSPKARTITVGSVPIVVGPYDYGFVILSEKGMKVSVSCEGKANVAELSVQ